MRSKTNYESGHFYEIVALWYLRLKGYKLIAHNFVVKRGTGAGEIDLIMIKGKTIVFFEVKQRKTFALAAEAISIKNQMRIIRASAAFLQKKQQYASHQIRYDAILFKKGQFWPHHIINAWRIL